jgi:predicted TIM-barrel fold metal-dependent hydrolase
VLTPDRWLAEFEQHAFPDDVKHKILLTNAQRLFHLA